MSDRVPSADRAATVYDAIGRGYSTVRRSDDRLAALIERRLGDAETVVNFGAGTGNYESAHRRIVALEPSALMISQRPAGAHPAVRAVAEAAPIVDGAADASMAVSTIHHWSDLAPGLSEMARVAPRRVVYFSEPAVAGRYWLVDDYFPEILDMATNRAAPTAEVVAGLLGGDVMIDVVEIPADFSDGAGAYWARPESYCDPQVQASLSMFALLEPSVRRRGTEQLAADLRSGAWDARHGELRHQATADVGYRLVTSVA